MRSKSQPLILGQQVYYRLTDRDCVRALNNAKIVHGSVQGGELQPGQLLPAIVVNLSEDGVNLHIWLDGSDSLWCQGVEEGEEHGQWTRDAL